MEACFQGKIDNFCAIYSVLNAVKLLRDIPFYQARILLNEALFRESRDADNWIKVLQHLTDYDDLVTRMLDKWKNQYSYTHEVPFIFKRKKNKIDMDEFWQYLQKNIKPKSSTAVIRFCRFMPQTVTPFVDHWSTISHVDEDNIYLFDCSLEPSGWYVLPRERFFLSLSENIVPYWTEQQSIPPNQSPPFYCEQEYGVIILDHLHIVRANSSFGMFNIFGK